MKTIWRVIGGILVFGILIAALALVLREPAAPVLPDVVTDVVTTPDLETNLPPPVAAVATNPPVLARPAMAGPVNRRLTPLHLMNDALDLSPEQSTNVDVILIKQQKELAGFRRETSLSRPQRIVRINEMRAAHDEQLKAVLTPEQFDKWRKRGMNFQEAFQQAPRSPGPIESR